MVKTTVSVKIIQWQLGDESLNKLAAKNIEQLYESGYIITASGTSGNENPYAWVIMVDQRITG